MGINNEFADTRECTTIIVFYNGNRSRNVRVIANIALDLIKYRCRKEGAVVKDLYVNRNTFGQTVLNIMAFTSNSIAKAEGFFKNVCDYRALISCFKGYVM